MTDTHADIGPTRAVRTWRSPYTIPHDGRDCICAYRWTKDDELRITVGRYFKGDDVGKAGIIASPDGSYIPCVGWLPLPSNGEHEPWIPLYLRTEPAAA